MSTTLPYVWSRALSTHPTTKDDCTHSCTSDKDTADADKQGPRKHQSVLERLVDAPVGRKVKEPHGGFEGETEDGACKRSEHHAELTLATTYRTTRPQDRRDYPTRQRRTTFLHTRNSPVEDRDRTGNHVREQRAPGRTREPDNVVLGRVTREVVRAAEDPNKDVLGGHVCCARAGVSAGQSLGRGGGEDVL